MKTIPVPVDLLQALGAQLAADPAFVRISQLLTGLQAAMKAAEAAPAGASDEAARKILEDSKKQRPVMKPAADLTAGKPGRAARKGAKEQAFRDMVG